MSVNIRSTYQHRSMYFREMNPPNSESTRYKITVYVVTLSPTVGLSKLRYINKCIATEIIFKKSSVAHHKLFQIFIYSIYVLKRYKSYPNRRGHSSRDLSVACRRESLGTFIHNNFVLHAVQEIRDFDGRRRWMHAGMLLSVQHHRRALGEALAANVADVRPLADVGEQVDLLRAEAAEGLAAYRAEIRLLARVRPEVLREAVLELKLHAALLADVLHLVQLGVAVEILLGLEALPANLTLELLDLRLVLVMLVEVQGALAGIGRAAYVAHAGLRVVVLHVRRVIGLDLEHLAALFAAVVVVLGVLADIVYLQIRLRARLEVAQGAGVKLRGLVVDLHMPRKIRTGLEALGADRALVRP